MTLKQYLGAAATQALAAGITNSALSFTTSDSTGMPGGGTAPFVVVLELGTSKEEKVLVDSRSANTYTVNASGRGYDGTAAVAHNSGAPVQHCLDAVSIQEVNAHVNDTARDDHIQYLNTTRHDVAGRHTFGAAYGSPSTPAAVGTSAAAGAASGPAKADHVHILGNGSISAATMFGSAVVPPAALQPLVIATANLIDVSVTTAKIADGAVTAAKQDPALPQLVMGYAERTTTQTGIGASPTDVTSLSITFTAVSGRKYKITSSVDINQVTAGGIAFVNVTDSSNVEQRKTLAANMVTGEERTGTVVFRLSGLVGSVTYKMRASTSGGTLTINSASLIVEDVGT